jgi:uncharacterized protein (DUF169 family)
MRAAAEKVERMITTLKFHALAAAILIHATFSPDVCVMVKFNVPWELN